MVDGGEDMIADQRDFVAWWEGHVRRPGNQPINAGLHYLTVDDAEALTGVKQWQVSRWRTKLANEDAYRQSIIEAAHRSKYAGRHICSRPSLTVAGLQQLTADEGNGTYRHSQSLSRRRQIVERARSEDLAS
jgi:hypothetical protein